MPLGRILVIRGGAIGDFVLTLPVLAALRKSFPDVALDLLAYPHIASLASTGKLVDAIRPIESRALAGFFARQGSLDSDLSHYFARCHVIFSYLYDPDGIFKDNIDRVSHAQFVQGPHRPDDTGPGHATDQLLKPLERLAIFEADPTPRLEFKGTSPEPNRIALHPGSGSPRKNWPEQNWARLLIRLVAETDLNFTLIGGEAEGDRLTRLAERIPAKRCLLVRSQPLTEVARQLVESTVFVGHDSGISHLAAAVEVPVLALWGESNEAVWRPRSTQVTLLHGGPGLTAVTPEAVFTAVLKLLGGASMVSS